MSAAFFLLARLPVLFFVAMPSGPCFRTCLVVRSQTVVQYFSLPQLSPFLFLQRSSICIQFSNHQTTDGLGRQLAEHVRP